jgi:uncharacterized glyoxalase superfamily protein PhnB
MATEQLAPSVYPTVRYADPAKGMQFLVDAFGFKVHDVHKGPKGEIAHAELTYGNSMVMLGQSGSGEGAVFDTGPQSIYVVVDDDIDAFHDRAVAAGAEIVYPLTDQDYGSRDFSAKDVAGHVWSFGTYRPTLAVKAS